MFRVEAITEAALDNFAKLTYPQFRPYLTRSLQDRNVITGGAAFMGEPAGLVIARVNSKSDTKHGNLLSLYVLPRYRRLGIGARLLEFAENRLVKAGCTSAEFSFTGPAEGRPEAAQLLKSAGWESLRITMELHRLDALALSREGWVNRPVPPGYKVVRYDKLQPGLRTQIETEQAKENGFLSPFGHSAEFPRHLPTSLYLTRNGRVLAWAMTSVISPDALMYDVLYSTKELRGTGTAIRLVAVSIREQAILGISQILYHVNIHNEAMLRFAGKRLLKHAINKAYNWTSLKKLTVGVKDEQLDWP